MSSEHDDGALDARTQAYLDGELSASGAAAFEADLRADDALRNRVATLRGIDDWFRATRSVAPSSLDRRLDLALTADAPGAAGSRSPEPMAAREAPPRGRVIPIPTPHPGRRWAPAAALAAAAVLAVLLLPGLWNRNPGPGTTADVSGEANTVRYEFHLRAPDASEVCLVGDFNAWKICDVRLQHVGEDLWTVALQLPRGRHEYMFVVDGRWMTDPAAAGYTDDGFGDRNAVVLL